MCAMADGTRAERTDAWANRPVPAFPSVRRLRAGFAGGGLFGNAVSTMLSSVFVLLVNMATGVLTARLLGPDGRGLQAALVLWPQFLAFTTTLGLHSALLYYMKKDPERESALYAAGMLMSLLTGTGAVAIGALIIPPRLSGYPEWAAAAAVGLTGVVPFIHLVFLSNASLRAREQFRLFNRTRWLIPVMTLAMLLALAASGRLTPLTAAIAYQAAYVPVAVWAVVREIPAFRRMLRNGTASVREAAGRLVRYGTRSYGADLLGNLILYMDQLFLVGLLAPEALGLYTVAVSLSRMLNVFSTSLVAVLFPEASGLPENEAATLSLRVFKISMLAGLAAALALSALAPPALRLLYGAAFMEAIPVFRLLVLEVVAGGGGDGAGPGVHGCRPAWHRVPVPRFGTGRAGAAASDAGAAAWPHRGGLEPAGFSRFAARVCPDPFPHPVPPRFSRPVARPGRSGLGDGGVAGPPTAGEGEAADGRMRNDAADGGVDSACGSCTA